MKLAVCGCSFSAHDPRAPGTEYGSIIADHFGWDYVNLARPSASNHIIRLQIDEAVQQGADWVIVNWTNSERLEWNYTNKQYKPRTGIKHVTYWDADHLTDAQCHPRADHDPVITSDSINNIFHRGRLEQFEDLSVKNGFRDITHWFTPERYEAVRHVYLHLWDDQLAQEKDSFLAESACWTLERAGINYLTGFMPHADIPEDCLLPSTPQEWYDKYNPHTDQYVYHITVDQQRQYAREIIEHIATKKPR